MVETQLLAVLTCSMTSWIQSTSWPFLTAQGYDPMVMFRDNAVATLKMTKYDDDEDDLEIVFRKVAKAVSKESSEFQ